MKKDSKIWDIYGLLYEQGENELANELVATISELESEIDKLAKSLYREKSSKVKS